MIYLELFLGFLKVGLFTFGGAYAAIPLIRETVLGHGWLTDETLSHMIAVSESTPGPIMVNMATYIGSSQAGFWGAVLATTAVVLPSFVIILLLSLLLKNAVKRPGVQAVFAGIRPCIVGIILFTGLEMTVKNCLPETGVDLLALLLLALLCGISYLWKKRKKKPISPIALMGVAAVLGAVLYSFV